MSKAIWSESFSKASRMWANLIHSRSFFLYLFCCAAQFWKVRLFCMMDAGRRKSENYHRPSVLLEKLDLQDSLARRAYLEKKNSLELLAKLEFCAELILKID